MPIEIPQRHPCPFCQMLSGESEWYCAFVYQDSVISSFVNPGQYGKAGMLVVPNRHAATLLELTPDEVQSIYLHARQLVMAVRDSFDPMGFNLFQNNGVAAGQTIPHFHLHVVPRYGDHDPRKIFSEKECPIISKDERIEIAKVIRTNLK